ncbi:hypothetical protein EMCG_00220 [[Emmonsia] crescens]|uniref:Uncharacterized protein n=1 Tax=[Emmonsia] crescens TaxID=73230 RepID=A0A0G2I7Q2_9EURO|nr:hypothetical protein EMCG_00220 [Emmonsia crescens UAMH 3008]
MALTINGLGASVLPQVIDALQRLQDNPELLARERSQLNDPPPPYASGETTQPPSPARPLPEADRLWQLKRRREERLNSMPGCQFTYQRRLEEKRLIEQNMRWFAGRKETLPFNMKLNYTTNAENNVTNRWIEQGIWNDKWLPRAWGARWKHEESPEPEFEPAPGEPDSEPILYSGPRPDPPKPRLKIVSQERRAAHERETMASRPYYQFRFQISKEREWLEDEPDSELIDIDAKAYENAKDHWLEQKIWNPKWGHMPGMTWIHEDPDDDDNSDEALPTNAIENNEQPTRRLYYRYRSDTFGFTIETSPSPEPTGEGRPSLAPRTIAASNGDGPITANKSMPSSPVPQSPENTENTEILQESTGGALHLNATPKIRKRAKRNLPTRQLRKRPRATSEPADALQDIVANAVGSIPAGDDDSKSSHATSPPRHLNLEMDVGEHQQLLRRSPRISRRCLTNETTVSASKVPQSRNDQPSQIVARTRKRRKICTNHGGF